MLTMTRGKPISDDVRSFIIRLSPTMPVEEIAMYANISVRSMERILVHFRQTGNICTPKQPKSCPNRVLCDYDIQHMFTTLQETPDIYLDELRVEMEERCGVLVS